MRPLHVRVPSASGSARAAEHRRERDTSEEAIRRLQRSAGNAAVTRLLRQRTELARPAGEADSMHVKLTEPGLPRGAPLILGESIPPKRIELKLPEVKAVPASGGVKLEATEAADCDAIYSVAAPAGEAGRAGNQIVHRQGAKAWVAHQNFPSGEVEIGGDPDTKYTRLEDMTVVYAVSPAESNLIRVNEQQHPDDFARAFEISVGAVVTAVSALGGQVFANEADAFQALAAKLDLRLFPQYPTLPGAWPQRLYTVLDQLYDLSKERDRLKEHTPKRRHGGLDVPGHRFTMSPVMELPSGTPTDAWVTLGRAGVARYNIRYGTPNPPAPVGAHIQLKQPFTGTLYSTANRGALREDTLPAGTTGTVAGQVIHGPDRCLQIDLDSWPGASLLVDVHAVARLFVAAQAARGPGVGDTLRVRATAQTQLTFWLSANEAKQPAGDPWDQGAASAFANQDLTIAEVLPNGAGWVVKDSVGLFAIVPANCV